MPSNLHHQLAHRLNSITSSSRLATPSPPLAARSRVSPSPAPLATSSSSSGISSLSTKFSYGSSRDGGQSGSETEREPSSVYSASRSSHSQEQNNMESSVSSIFSTDLPPNENSRSSTINLLPKSAREKGYRTSIASSDNEGPPSELSIASDSKLLRRMSVDSDTSRVSADSHRRVSLEGGGTAKERQELARALAATRRSPTSAGRRSRQPLPKEFRDRSFEDAVRYYLLVKHVVD